MTRITPATHRIDRPASVGTVLLMLALALPSSASAPASAQGPAAAPITVVHRALGPPPLDASALGVVAPVSAVLVEGASGQVLASRDADVRRPIASATKLVTALAVVEALPVGSAVTVGEEVRGIEGSSYGLRPGEVRSVEDLLVGLLLRSGNEVAVALAVAVDGSEEAFLARMSRVVMALGIDARFATPSGLDPADALSASELAVVARAALVEPRIRSILATPVLIRPDGGRVENRNLFLLDVSGATGLKTGFTRAAGYTLAASAARDGRELVAVVLGAVDDRDRRSTAARLVEHGFAATVATRLERSVTLRTASGPVRIATDGTLLTVAVESEVTVDWPVALRPDDTLAQVEVRSGGMPVGTVAVVRQDGRGAAASPSLGRALVEGAYAALRPYGLSDGLR